MDNEITHEGKEKINPQKIFKKIIKNNKLRNIF